MSVRNRTHPDLHPASLIVELNERLARLRQGDVQSLGIGWADVDLDVTPGRYDFHIVPGTVLRTGSNTFVVRLRRRRTADFYLAHRRDGSWVLDLVSAGSIHNSTDILLNVPPDLDCCDAFVRTCLRSAGRIRRLAVSIGGTGDCCPFGVFIGLTPHAGRLTNVYTECHMIERQPVEIAHVVIDGLEPSFAIELCNLSDGGVQVVNICGRKVEDF
jgi:hypothetical protein